MASRNIFRHENIIRILIYLASVAVIVYFLPRESKFRYHFQEGKPWKYGLLTAPFDFPIYKSDNQVAQEKDSVLKSYQPYYKINNDMMTRNLAAFDDYYNKNKKGIDRKEYNNIKEQITEIYVNGIISAKALNDLKKNDIKTIRVIDKNVSRLKHTTNLMTVRQAYEDIIQRASEGKRKNIKDLNINNFLSENLTFDSITSQKVKNELIQNVSISSGMVQAGERIVDRGEIITPQTFGILNSLETVSQKRSGSARQQSLTLIGQVFLTLIAIGAMLLYLRMFRIEMYNRFRDIQVILLMITSIVVLSSFLSHFRVLSLYLVPFAIVPIVIRTFLDSRTGFFAHFVTITICSFIAPFAFEFMLLQTAIGVATIFVLKDLTERSQLFKTASFVLLTYCVVYVVYTMIVEGNWQKVNIEMFLYFTVSSAMILFAYLLIFMLERTFGFTSNVTLVELSNINSPLLRRLSEECSGTFQHALLVSNLAAQAAMKIGANVQLVRVGALYHDIGKLSNPRFFVENQLDINPHDMISTEQSINIIKQHVTEGVKLAQKENLPSVVTEFITTHHGAGKLKYFYNKWCNENPDIEPDNALFSYDGPNPQTTEQALVMMADSLEAASRTLKDYSDDSITKLVNGIIDSQINEGMFKNTPLTFKNLEIVRQEFIQRLKTMYHARISYPELKK